MLRLVPAIKGPVLQAHEMCQEVLYWRHDES
jgi:hypothetical protein